MAAEKHNLVGAVKRHLFDGEIGPMRANWKGLTPQDKTDLALMFGEQGIEVSDLDTLLEKSQPSESYKHLLAVTQG